MGRILQRCDVCKRFHVVYIVDDPLYPGGKAHYCHHCWKQKFGAQAVASATSSEQTRVELLNEKSHKK